MVIVYVVEHVNMLLNEASGEEYEQTEITGFFFSDDDDTAKEFCRRKNEEEAPKAAARLWFKPWNEYICVTALPLPQLP